MSQLPPAQPDTLVDLRPWQMAEALAALATSAEESDYAREAEHLADHEVDQTFAAALRQATLHRPTLSGDALNLSRNVARLQQVVAADQARVHALTQQDPGDDLDIAKAQLGLDSDQLTEAQQDLARAGGDERGRIKQELAAHEAAMRTYDAQTGKPVARAVAASQVRNTVAASLIAWLEERRRRKLLQTAAAEAQAAADALTVQHNQLEKTAVSTPTAAGKTERLASLSDQSTRSQLQGIYDDRIATERQLATVYGKWSEQVSLQHRMTAHLLMQSFALIAFILICVIALDALVQHLAHRAGAVDHRRIHTLSGILKFGIRFIGLVLILLVIFGTPNQMPTILGLATAGLTVALQDFIIAFFGWFVLMGKNGIRVGDLVEINGVAGEVVNVGLFRTAMLETGNSSDKGHPTGRRITFINSFAIKGQYFNYSTSGQWMWDEIRIAIPAERDAYATIDLVRKEVVDETANDTHTAEQEWKRVNRRFTAEPAVDMRPGSSGIDLIVRYVTRASDRFEVRNRLYHRILSLLHKPSEDHSG
ncbi:MAG: mechanosensitive ion channel family protein [Acidobacteriota bacterium]|nr:mechanosensitive ion channel family protein [Acidobacteriota bacterium]